MSKDEIVAWLIERRDNCLWIARTKAGDDKQGWEEDAGFFEAAIGYLKQA